MSSTVLCIHAQARTKQTARKLIQGRAPVKAPKRTKKTARKSMPTHRPAEDPQTQIRRAMRKVKRGTRALQYVHICSCVP